MEIQEGKLTIDLQYGILYCGMVGCWRTMGPYESPVLTVDAAVKHHKTHDGRRRTFEKEYTKAHKLEAKWMKPHEQSPPE